MGDERDLLTLHTTGLDADGGPLRSLVQRVMVRSAANQNLALLGALSHGMIKGVRFFEGSVLEHATYARFCVLKPHDTVAMDLKLRMPLEAIRRIERARLGTDLDFEFSLNLLVADVSESETLLNPRRIPVAGHINDILHRTLIPQSEWLKFLRIWEYQETALIELPLFQHTGRYGQARAYVEEAVTHFRRGEWGSTLVSCRLVFESIAETAGDRGAERPNIKDLRKTLGSPGPKGDRLDEAVASFGKFLHLGRHVPGQESGLVISASDAHLALVVTTEFWQYCERVGRD